MELPIRMFASFVLSAAAVSVQAATPLLPAGPSDRTADRLVRLPAPAAGVERSPVHFAWPLDPAAPLSTPAPFMAESREYWFTVDGASLARGVDVDVTAPGALLRVSPATGAAAVRDGALQIHQGGQRVAARSLADGESLRAAGMQVEPGAAIAGLAASAGAGRYQLRVDGARGRYVVHVFDPNSDVVLKARPRADVVQAGRTLEVEVAFQRAGRGAAAKAEALLVAPDGETRDVTLRLDGRGQGTARVQVADVSGQPPGLWELQVLSDDGRIARDARTAFAIVAPTARLTGQWTLDPAAFAVQLPVEVASPGRYEVRGTLYATGPDGLLAPVVQAHSADWLEPGDRRLDLVFDKSLLPRGHRAPFEVRHLELLDQARMAPLESRGRAIRF